MISDFAISGGSISDNPLAVQPGIRLTDFIVETLTDGSIGGIRATSTVVEAMIPSGTSPLYNTAVPLEVLTDGNRGRIDNTLCVIEIMRGNFGGESSFVYFIGV